MRGRMVFVGKRLAAAALCLFALTAFTGCEWLNSKEVQSYSQEFGKQVESAMNELGEAVDSAVAEAQSSNDNVSSGWAQPLSGAYRITQHFGDVYDDKGGKRHLGIDVCADGSDIPVYAIYGGTVLKAGWVLDKDGNIGYNGEIVVIKHDLNGDTFYSAYCHLKENSFTVKEGETISSGQQVGIMGNTSKEKIEIHLHLTVYSGRSTLDPYGYIDNANDGSYIDYTDERGTYRFYDPEAVLADNGQTIINNYFY